MHAVNFVMANLLDGGIGIQTTPPPRQASRVVKDTVDTCTAAAGKIDGTARAGDESATAFLTPSVSGARTRPPQLLLLEPLSPGAKVDDAVSSIPAAGSDWFTLCEGLAIGSTTFTDWFTVSAPSSFISGARAD